ncbi:MAG TPA: hypothetical protein VF120_13370, partial [Ktedonobacterales bacterium]
YNALSGEVLDTLHLRLNHLATVAGELERAARAQIYAAHRQERMARQISEGARDIDTLVNTMQQGQLSMHESASDVWAEMSQPGAKPDPATAMRYARQAVVMAAHVGVATEDARTRCNHVVRLMNQVIAEGHALSGHGRETERRAAELREVIAHVERAIEEPLSPRTPAAYASTPLAERAPTSSAVHDLADASLLARLGRVARARVLREAHAVITRALDAGERIARQVEARLPDRAQQRASSDPPTAAVSRPRTDATTRPSTGPRAEHSHPSSPSGWYSASGSLSTEPSGAPLSSPGSQPLSRPTSRPDPQPAQTQNERAAFDTGTTSDDTAELPRLIDLTRRSQSSPRGESAPRPQESTPGSPGSQAKPLRETHDEDGENFWRLP